jgi:hypothetical protein
MKCSVLAAAASLLATVSAHGGVGTYTIGSEVYKGFVSSSYPPGTPNAKISIDGNPTTPHQAKSPSSANIPPSTLS